MTDAEFIAKIKAEGGAAAAAEFERVRAAAAGVKEAADTEGKIFNLHFDAAQFREMAARVRQFEQEAKNER